MKIFRLHIVRIYGLFLLLVGIGLSIANITEQMGHRHAAFTSWLGSHLRNDDSEAHKKLDILSNDRSELEEVIRKASEVVTSHPDDFKLPVGGDDEQPDSEIIFHLLLTQWNQFQNTEAGMSKAVLIETAKSQTILPNDGKIGYGSFSNLKNSVPKTEPVRFSNSESSPNSPYFLSPLKGGIAIGAP